jgi:hypothetical protein
MVTAAHNGHDIAVDLIYPVIDGRIKKSGIGRIGTGITDKKAHFTRADSGTDVLDGIDCEEVYARSNASDVVFSPDLLGHRLKGFFSPGYQNAVDTPRRNLSCECASCAFGCAGYDGPGAVSIRKSHFDSLYSFCHCL